MSKHLQPGDSVPEDGDYVACSVFGTPTDTHCSFKQGESLPRQPRGFTWKRINDDQLAAVDVPGTGDAPGTTATS